MTNDPAPEKFGFGCTVMQKGCVGFKEKVTTPPRSIGKPPDHEIASIRVLAWSASSTILLQVPQRPSQLLGTDTSSTCGAEDVATQQMLVFIHVSDYVTVLVPAAWHARGF